MSDPTRDEVRDALATDPDAVWWFVVDARGFLAAVGRSREQCESIARKWEGCPLGPYSVETGTKPRLQ